MTRVGPKIQDYAAIGDGRSAALVSREGSLDWLCWPRFDSPSLFGGLLDGQAGGAWGIAPTGPGCRAERWYVDGTNVLQTRFHAPTSGRPSPRSGMRDRWACASTWGRASSPCGAT